jgi:hypothetical protein
MITKEKTLAHKKRFYNKTTDKFTRDNLKIEVGTKMHNENSNECKSTRSQERNRIIEKGSKIIVAVFIVSFIYSLSFLLKYCQTTQFESIISALIFSLTFTCLVGFLVGKYLIQKSNSQLSKNK